MQGVCDISSTYMHRPKYRAYTLERTRRFSSLYLLHLVLGLRLILVDYRCCYSIRHVFSDFTPTWVVIDLQCYSYVCLLAWFLSDLHFKGYAVRYLRPERTSNWRVCIKHNMSSRTTYHSNHI